jgi:hypothetical protein
MGAQTGYGFVGSLGESAKINTPSQHRVLCVMVDHWLSLAVDIEGADALVMGR